MQYITKSEKETLTLAKKFAAKLKGGEVIGLVGDLGAGKTAFVRGVAKSLGIKNRITSPTFVLMKNYKVKHDKIKMFVHIDAYRLKTDRDLEAIGAKEYFGRPDTIVFIEWADMVKKILPKKTIFIKFKHLITNNRSIII